MVAAAPWACSAAIRLWRNACIAWAGSEALVDEFVDEELVDDDEPDVALALEVEVLSPVAPICASASMIEFIKPPPDGGGGGGIAAELASEEFVTSDCALVLLELAVNCASQLLMLETLLIVMSISVPVELRVNTT